MKTFEKHEDAKSAVDSFWDEVKILRIKYGIHDLMIMTQTDIEEPSGIIHSIRADFYGCQNNTVPMAATALGYFTKLSHERIAKLINGDAESESK